MARRHLDSNDNPLTTQERIRETLHKFASAKRSPVISAILMDRMRALRRDNIYNIDGGIDLPGILEYVTYPLQYKEYADRLKSNDNDIWARQNMFGGTPQRTYLLDRDLQEKEFLKDGWIRKGSNEYEYGLVNKAVGNKQLPVWQMKEDAIPRHRLTPIGNIDNQNYTTVQLPQPANFPTAVYIGDDGRFYQKAWDLNDYGGGTSNTANIFGKIADFIGSPTVVTTGFQPIGDEPVRDNDWTFWNRLEDKINKVPNYNKIMREKYNLLPELIVTPKRRSIKTTRGK